MEYSRSSGNQGPLPAGINDTSREITVRDCLFEETILMNPVRYLFAILSMAVLSACNTGQSERGHASFYGHNLNGCKTASGETYHSSAYTAAHRKLPFGTKVCVKNLKNGRTVTLRINDRGPYVKGRIIDVSETAARELGMTRSGVVPVEVVVMNNRF